MKVFPCWKKAHHTYIYKHTYIYIYMFVWVCIVSRIYPARLLYDAQQKKWPPHFNTTYIYIYMYRNNQPDSCTRHIVDWNNFAICWNLNRYGEYSGLNYSQDISILGWRNNSDQTHSCLRHLRISASWGPVWNPPYIIELSCWRV